MAFQLVDDVLDFTARESILGKPVGNDLREGKVTLPLILALQEATAGEREAVETVLRDRGYDRVPLKSIIAIINKYKGIHRAREQARGYTAKARDIMAKFPESSCQQALLAVTDLITDRDH
jgi:geranylgeranyl pyrophosphate synthase